jgi:hypothetical protein
VLVRNVLKAGRWFFDGMRESIVRRALRDCELLHFQVVDQLVKRGPEAYIASNCS